jgi:hypothetical protein
MEAARMLWFFERDEHSLHLETRYDDDTSEYVVMTRYSDGREQTERFTKANKFRSWLVEFDQNLETQQWTLRRGGPVVLPDGWPDKWLT